MTSGSETEMIKTEVPSDEGQDQVDRVDLNNTNDDEQLIHSNSEHEKEATRSEIGAYDKGVSNTKSQPIILGRFHQNYPRTHDFIFVVVLPILSLILIAMFFGYFVGVIESRQEEKENDDALAILYGKDNKLSNIVMPVVNSYEECLDNRPPTIGFENLKEYLHDCTRIQVESSMKLIDEAEERFNSLFLNEFLTQNWIVCKSKKYPSELPWDQVQLIWEDWQDSRKALKSEFIEQGISESIADERAVNEATGYKHCSTNVPAGALFWFVIMTTIGYGNTAPHTLGGRLMVYTLGLLSILYFSGTMGRASMLILKMSDDFFRRKKSLKKFSEGLFAAFFWLVIFWIYMVLMALVFISQNISWNYFDEISFQEAFWWAYISITTVGFGDIFIPPQRFRFKNLLLMAVSMLVGFVFLANFILKLANVFMDWAGNNWYCQKRLNVDDISYGQDDDKEDADLSLASEDKI